MTTISKTRHGLLKAGFLLGALHLPSCGLPHSSAFQHGLLKGHFYVGGGFGLQTTQGSATLRSTHRTIKPAHAGGGSYQSKAALPFQAKSHGIHMHGVFGYHWTKGDTYGAIDVLYQGGRQSQTYTVHQMGTPIFKVHTRRRQTFGVVARYGKAVDQDLYLYGSLGILGSTFDIKTQTFSASGARRIKKHFGLAPGIGVIRKMDGYALRLDYLYLHYFNSIQLTGQSHNGDFHLRINPSSHVLLLSILIDL